MLKGIIAVIALGLFTGGCTAAATPTLTPIPTRTGPTPTAIAQSPITPVPRAGTPVVPPDVTGKFVFAPGDGSIWLQDSPSATARVLVKASSQYFSASPAFSPDGSQIAFVLEDVTGQGPETISIQLIGADGSNQHLLTTAPDSKSNVGWPSFSPDGKWVYYAVDSANHKTSEIRRIPVTGGSSVKLVDDGRSPVLSPDGKRLAFIRFNIDHFTTSLWLADADGNSPQLLLDDNAFLTIMAPRFSPDGKNILFSASGPPKHGLSILKLSTPQECIPQILCLLAQPAYADGLPWDLWLESVDGSHFRQLTNIGSDSPWPAWSRDGKYIAFMDASGTYLLNMSDLAITQLNRNRGHGVFDWWSPTGK